jgi:hypothetical protein
MDDIDMSPKPQPSGGDLPPETGIDAPPPPPGNDVVDAPPDLPERQESGFRS